MAIQMNGDFEVSRKPEEVYAFLTDPERFAPLMPDFEGVEMLGDGEFLIKVKVGISYIRGTAAIKMRLVEKEAPRRALYQGSGAVPGGSVNLTAGFELAPAGQGTRVQWKGEAQVFGRIASMAGGLLEPLARKNLQTLIESLRSALSQ